MEGLYSRDLRDGAGSTQALPFVTLHALDRPSVTESDVASTVNPVWFAMHITEHSVNTLQWDASIELQLV